MAPQTSDTVYSFEHLSMEFKVTVTTRAATMEKWIYRVSEDFLCDASAKIVGLDCEFTDKVKVIKQKLLPEDKRQRAAVLQLCVANDIILFQIFQATKVPCLLKKFLSSEKIWFFGAAIDMDRRMLMPYGLNIKCAFDLQKMINIHKLDPGVKNKRIPSLYDLSNAVLGTNLEKKVLVL
ncbi:uncharacterized protein [Lolium perenne]|uniref:uncharacterized protein n=1 Tax=Lolium perenne TaxID=4522 RepID=UPI003A9A61A1